MNLNEEQKKELKSLLILKKNIDKRTIELQAEMANFNERMYEVTGLDKSHPINYNDLLIEVL